MSLIRTTEGFLDFAVERAGRACQTWYTVFGDLDSGVRPLVALHGGPGVSHNYLRPLKDLAEQYGIPIILYDQLGCGKSTHLPEKMGVGDFWTEQLFMDELDNLVAQLGIRDSFDAVGHSWGGMLLSRYATTHPQGLRKLIIACSPASMKTWVSEADKLREKLPQDVQAILEKHEAEGTTDSEEYEAAVEVFYKRHVCRVDPYPQDLADSFENLKKDPTVYMTMQISLFLLNRITFTDRLNRNGPSEFFVSGSLNNWEIIEEIHKITVPTMLINGHYDEATDIAVEPFTKIANVKWVKFMESSHSPMHEEREKFMRVISDFLKS
ncbi:MAG: hypothetical protein MMC33_009409 [Icmadophila ericetorum]|nr:hypothetical protein [Icmadophila ericetorum]